jgi:hypothetical protein
MKKEQNCDISILTVLLSSANLFPNSVTGVGTCTTINVKALIATTSIGNGMPMRISSQPAADSKDHIAIFS